MENLKLSPINISKLNQPAAKSVKRLEDPILLHILANIKQQDEPMTRLAALYMLNDLLRRSLVPRRATFCLKEGLLASLLEILSKNFDPADVKNDAQLYTLAVEILWRCTFLPVEDHSLLACPPVIHCLMNFISMKSQFYQFLPVFTETLKNICQGRCFTKQEVTALHVTPQILEDLKLYSEEGAEHSDLGVIYACSVTLNVTGKEELTSLTDLFIAESLAWPVCDCREQSLGPQSNSLTPPKLSKPHGQASSAQKPSSATCPQKPRKYSLVPVDEGQSTLPSKLESPSSPGLQSPGTATHLPHAGASSSRSQGRHELVHNVADFQYVWQIGGKYFWGQVGADSIKSVTSVTQRLTMALPTLNNVAPRVGDVVAVKLEETDAGDDHTVVRGRVIDVQDEWAMVFAIDYGFTRVVRDRQIFALAGTAQWLVKFPPQAHVCCLAGVQSPPVDDAAVEVAVATLVQLCKMSSVGVMLFDMGALDALWPLLHCGKASIQLQVVRLLTNMAAITAVSKRADWSVFFKPLLGILRSTSVDSKPSHQERNILVATMSALCNMMYRRADSRAVFMDLEGQQLVLELMLRHKSATAVVIGCAKLLRNCYPGLISFKGPLETFECDKVSDYREDHNLDETGCETDTVMYGEREGESSDEEEMLLLKNVHMQAPLSSDEEENTSASEVQSSADRDVDRQDNGCMQGLSVGKADKPLLLVDGSMVSIYSPEVIELNSTLPCRFDDTHHMYEEKRLDKISATDLAQVVCGMLNNRLGGHIYFGLSREGQVVGIKLTRDQRDELRLGLDNLMTYKFLPPILHMQLSVIYKPVVQRLDNGEFASLVDMFVVEIAVKPSHDTMYTLSKTGSCWHRFGPHTTKMTTQEVRQLIVLEEEEKYKSEIMQLRQQLQQFNDNESLVSKNKKV